MHPALISYANSTPPSGANATETQLHLGSQFPDVQFSNEIILGKAFMFLWFSFSSWKFGNRLRYLSNSGT